MNTFVVKAKAPGGQSFTSPEKSLLVDRTAPFLVGWRPRAPFPGLTEHVEYRFSEPLDPLSLGGVQLTLRDGGGFSVAHQLSLSEDGKGLRVIPAQPLVPPASLTAEIIRADIQDRSGNLYSQLSGDRVHSATWWPFARVGAIPAEGFGARADYAFTSNGHRVMAWEENNSGEVAVARWTGQATAEGRSSSSVGEGWPASRWIRRASRGSQRRPSSTPAWC